jgi:hypothetical protein
MQDGDLLRVMPPNPVPELAPFWRPTQDAEAVGRHLEGT